MQCDPSVRVRATSVRADDVSGLTAHATDFSPPCNPRHADLLPLPDGAGTILRLAPHNRYENTSGSAVLWSAAGANGARLNGSQRVELTMRAKRTECSRPVQTGKRDIYKRRL
jgi:hypothetical protein